MSADVQAFFDTATNTVTYLVSDPATGAAALIDPVLDFVAASGSLSHASADRLLAEIEARGLSLKWILETHAHADHLTAADYLRQRTGVPVATGALVTGVQKRFARMFEADDVDLTGAAFDRLLADGDTLELGELTIETLHTPGHTAACVTLRIGDAVFVGDTLFMPDYGTARTDFPGGDAATLYRSIRRILDLPPQTRVFTGHDYPPAGRAQPAWESSVAEQAAGNVHIHVGVDEQAFVAQRQARDKTLSPPALVMPALQVNIRAGALPPPTAAGHVYLRIPVHMT
ncbi:MBL fold metallo-hydrolase [Phenylobacterium aquaticum]|uniref:MBL fold metallo-hydrolase n=1 Tax=Phenylobacterium aquaticum TaxID=1763816 RepID=UPI001F5DD0E3|nr:MBL fold metallo-hydrolase [Phenylobacterium aquaticum]MCI3133838.1 MBL fold metallo-hydrolase [Phenylobacterium aquaticum]